ncbi:MAG: hypothetical protein HZA24_09975 [Nitrospirae bacterium]|nr:hypothetical protein [Nitrospirota bacterium]
MNAPPRPTPRGRLLGRIVPLAAALLMAWAAPALATGDAFTQDDNGEVFIAVAPVPGAGTRVHEQLAAVLNRTMADAHYLTGRLSVRTLDQPVAPANLADPALAEAVRQATGGATFLVWGDAQDDGAVYWYLVHLYALDPAFQSRRAAGQRPIVPVIHRLPDFTPDDPLKTAYAVLGVTYMRQDRYEAANQVLSVVNDYPELGLEERLPVVFFLALSDLVRGVGMGDAELTDRALFLFDTALPVIRQSRNPELIGAAILNRGFAYQLHPTQGGPAMITQAIASFEAALPYFPAQRLPAIHARILHHIATAEQRMPADATGAHLFRAIAFYKKALGYWNPDLHPDAYRGALHNLALCYQRLPVGDPVRNQLAAVALYRRILAMPSLAQRPEIRAATWGNMGQAYQALPPDRQGRNLWLAIAAYREALRYWDASRDPAQHGRFHQLTGQAFQQMPVGDRRDNLRRALAHFDAALKVTPLAADPMQHALIQVKRGVVLAQMPAPGERRSLTLAAAAFEEALTVLTPDNLPYFHAKVVQNLEAVQASLAALNGTGAPP